MHATLKQVRAFFVWLAGQPGDKARLQYPDADYFNLSGKDACVATAQRERKAPTLEQVRRAIETMPSGSEIERRNRAPVACALLTSAHEAKTKFSNTFAAYFFPVGEEVKRIGVGWVRYLRKRSYGVKTIRSFRQRASRWGGCASLRLPGWTGDTGARRHRFGRSSAKRSSARAPKQPNSEDFEEMALGRLQGGKAGLQEIPFAPLGLADAAGIRPVATEGRNAMRKLAEGEGFEPPLPLRVKRFSRPPVSTAHTSLRGRRSSVYQRWTAAQGIRRSAGKRSGPAVSRAPQAGGLSGRLLLRSLSRGSRCGARAGARRGGSSGSLVRGLALSRLAPRPVP